MLAIFKREFKSYFTTPVGYIVLAAFYFFLGWFFYTVYSNGVAAAEICIVSTSTVAVFILPVLTMRLMSDDRRQKVDQVLLTAPVKITSIVVGKLLAAFAVYAMAFIPTVIFEIIFASHLSVNILTYLYALLGAMLFGGVLISIGMFISSMTESPVISAMLSLLANVAILFMANFVSLLPQASGGTGFFDKIWEKILEFITVLLEKAALVSTFEKFSESVFNVADVVYLLSIIFVFVFLSVRSLEKRRWS